MQPDSHPGPAESQNNTDGARQVTSSGSRYVRSSVLAWLGVFGLAALPLVSCGDEDSTGLIGRGGSAGTAGAAGAAGAAGTSGGGSGGSAGTAGAAGAAGTAGAGGSAPATLDEAALAADYCGALAQLANPTDPDAGADAAAPDAGDAGTPAALGCPPSPTCVEEFTGVFGFFESESPLCVDEVQAYFGCLATQPASAFICVDGVPNVNLGNHGCVAQENAFNEGFVDNCAE